MEYVGIATQQERNNRKSLMLLMAFPLLIFALLYIACYILGFVTDEYDTAYIANDLFFASFPFVAVAILIWFIIAYFANVYIIDKATGAQTLQRKENKRVYNLVENLCISCGMTMPKVHVIEDTALNAFASGVSQKSYTVTLTRGIIDKLDDNELEGVIAHELMHIRNNDVRVLVISIVFVGIFAMLAQLSMRVLASSGRRSRSSKNGGAGVLLIVLLAMVLAFIGYSISILMRFAISRNREYMADAGAAYLTKDPSALASALRKISENSILKKEQSESVAQLFIEHKQPKKGFTAISGLFATHPPIEKRIAVLLGF